MNILTNVEKQLKLDENKFIQVDKHGSNYEIIDTNLLILPNEVFIQMINNQKQKKEKADIWKDSPYKDLVKLQSNNVIPRKLKFNIINFIDQKTRGDVLTNMAYGLFDYNKLTDVPNKVDIFETISIWLIIFKCMVGIDYTSIKTGKYPYHTDLIDVNQIFKQSIHISNNGVSEITFKNREVYIHFSNKYYNNAISQKDTYICEIEKTTEDEICNNGLIVKENEISDANDNHIPNQELTEIKKNNLLFDEADIKHGLSVMRSRNYMSTYKTIDDLLEMVNTDYLFSPKQVMKKTENEPIINKGTGAGGSNTNYYGKQFEEKTNNEQRLLGEGFTKITLTNNSKKSYGYYLSKTLEDKNITFVLQNGLKTYMKKKYNIEMFRCPDEAYIIEYNTGRKVIKILEKKEQRVDGSVETKLWSGPSLKREYELVLGGMFEVHYGFCVNSFLKKKITSTEKKYTILQTIFNESNIVCLFGDDEDYFETFDLWLHNSL